MLNLKFFFYTTIRYVLTIELNDKKLNEMSMAQFKQLVEPMTLLNMYVLQLL